MNLIILCHVLEILYFIFILAVFYCYLLTPARSRKTTFWLSVLFMLPDAVLMALNYEKIHLFHWVIILLPLVFLFSDPVEKRISAMSFFISPCCFAKLQEQSSAASFFLYKAGILRRLFH